MKRSTTRILILIMAFATPLAACAEVDPATPAGPDVVLPCDITSLFYVEAGSSDSNADGSEKNPYGTLQAALEAIEEGGALIISPGDYTGALHISKDVHFIGTASVDDSVFLRQDSAQNLITVDSGATVTFQDLTITGGQDAILWATGEGTSVTINDATLACPATPEAGSAGQGIVVEEGASLIFDAGSLTGCAAHGVLVHDGTLVMDMVTISNHAQGGVRLEGARAGSELRSVIIEDNQGFGVGLFCGELAMVQSIVQHTSPPGGGDGVLAATLAGLSPSDPLFGCTTSLTLGGEDLAMGNTISANHRAGVLIEGNVEALIQENTVEFNGNGGVWSIGTDEPGDTEVEILANRIIDNLHVGVGVVAAARANVAGNTILRTTPVEDWSQDTTFGDGVYAYEATSKVYGNTVKMNTRYGALISLPLEGSCLGNDNHYESNMQSWKWQDPQTGDILVEVCSVKWTPFGEEEKAPKDLSPVCDEEPCDPNFSVDEGLAWNDPSCVNDPSHASCPDTCSQDGKRGSGSAYPYANEEDCTGCFDGKDSTICPNDEATEKGLLLPCCQSPTHDYLLGSGD
jgi:hypothetical protein